MKKKLKQDLIKQEKRKNNSLKKKRLSLFVMALITGLLVYQTVHFYLMNRPGQLLDNAIKQESYQQFDKALGTYENIIHTYPETHEAEIALYNSALLWQTDLKDMRKALLLYLQLERDYPDSHFLFPARKEAAWIVKYALHDYTQAVGYYQRLYHMTDQGGYRFLYEIADCYFRLENYTQARIELENLLLVYPQSPLTPVALYRIGGLYLIENDPEKARETWRKLIADYPDSPYRAEAEFSLARSYEEVDQLEKALDAYSGLTDFKRRSLLESKITSLKQRISEKNKVLE